MFYVPLIKHLIFKPDREWYMSAAGKIDIEE